MMAWDLHATEDTTLQRRVVFTACLPRDLTLRRQEKLQPGRCRVGGRRLAWAGAPPRRVPLPLQSQARHFSGVAAHALLIHRGAYFLRRRTP